MNNFNGYMRVPLNGSLQDDEIIRRSELVGDWQRGSKRILRKPRLFSITAHIYNSIGAKAVTTINYRGKGGNKTIAEAAIIAFAGAREKFTDIDMSQVYICIRA